MTKKSDTEKKSKVVAIRLTPSMKAKLEARAKAGFRTLSQEIDMILTKAVKK